MIIVACGQIKGPSPGPNQSDSSSICCWPLHSINLRCFAVLSIHKPTLEGGKVPDNDGVVQVKTGAHLRRQQHLVGKEKTRPGSSKELIKSGNLELLRKESVLAPTEIDDLTTE